MVDGNTAAGLGSVYGGATVCAWYPITPSTSVAEAFEQHANRCASTTIPGQKKFAIIQAEDELAAIGMVIGAAWNGARSFTATSGPGVSLMSEFLGLAYFAEIAAVLWDIQRAGPFHRHAHAHPAERSDFRRLRLPRRYQTPAAVSVHAQGVFRLCRRPRWIWRTGLQTPIIVLSDLELGMNDNLSEPFEWDDERRYDRGKVLSADDLDNLEVFGRYLDVDGDGIGYRTYPGTHPEKGAFFTRGTSRDEFAAYTESPEAYQRNMERLLLKWETAATLVPAAEIYCKRQRHSACCTTAPRRCPCRKRWIC